MHTSFLFLAHGPVTFPHSADIHPRIFKPSTILNLVDYALLPIDSIFPVAAYIINPLRVKHKLPFLHQIREA